GGGAADDYDYAVVAYDTATRQELWVARYDGPSHGRDFVTSVAVSPDGTRVFATGNSAGGSVTEAYDAATGARLWSDAYAGPAGLGAVGNAIAVSPDGAHVYVEGSSHDHLQRGGAMTVSYASGTGAREWVRRYVSTNDLYANGWSVAASPDGSRVFVG